MATSKQLIQSILSRLSDAQDASDPILESEDVHSILLEMDDLADELSSELSEQEDTGGN